MNESHTQCATNGKNKTPQSDCILPGDPVGDASSEETGHCRGNQDHSDYETSHEVVYFPKVIDKLGHLLRRGLA